MAEEKNEFEKYAEEQRKAAEDARDDANKGETEEEYYERINLARASGIFGDLDTGVGAEDQVVSRDNEAATVATAEVDAAAEAGNDEAEDASTAEARRQIDVAAGTTESAEAADAKADDSKNEDKSDTPKSTTRKTAASK
jgi:hypothetical protein